MAYTEFYVTKGGSASDVNGGGPNLGGSDGPILTRTNCSSNVGGTTITTDDADGWGSVAQDDFLCFDTAGVKEYVQVASVAGDVITLAANPGTVTGSLSGKTVNVGGAWATVQHAADTVTTAFLNDSADDPPWISVGAGTYTENVQFDTNAGTLAIPISVGGFTSSPRDMPSGAARPTITQAGAGDTVEVTNVSYLTFADLIIEKTGTAGRGFDVSNRIINAYRCKILLGGTGSGEGLNNPLSSSYFEECEFDCTSSASGASPTYQSKGVFFGCVFHISSGSASTVMDRHSGILVNCLVTDGAGNTMECENNALILNTTIRGGGSDGVAVETNRGNVRASNCIVVNNGGYGIDATNGAVLGSNNNLGLGAEANTSGTSTGKYYSTGHADNNADPLFTSASSDLTLQSGSPDKGTGIPTTMPGRSDATSLDRGGLQRVEPAGGGGASLNLLTGLVA